MDMRALIVDDEESMRELLSRFLRSKGMTVSSAGDGGEALARLTGSGYDLVLVDVVLPKVGGVEVASRLRRGGPSRSAAVFLMTGLDCGEYSWDASGRWQGAIEKPFSLEDLWKRVSAVLGAGVGPAPPVIDKAAPFR